MIRVMIAEDNQELCSGYRNFLTKDNEIQIVSCTLDGCSTLEAYVQFKPDVLLLDLDLPRINGIELINELTNIPKEKDKCNIIVTTGSSVLRNELLNTSKLYKIFIKPFDFQELLDTIKQVPIYNQEDFNQESLNSLLLKLSFNLYSKGTKYLIDSIVLANTNPNLLYNISNLYSLVASQNHTSENIIKWSITNSLSSMNRYVDKKLLYSIFCEYDGRNLTPKYFISLLLRYINRVSL